MSKPNVGFPPACTRTWSLNALGIKYRVAARKAPAADGTEYGLELLEMPSRNDVGLCIPYNFRALPHNKPDRCRMKRRHHMHYNRFSWYLYVYLGTDGKHNPVFESLHRIITLGMHGRREEGEEVSHSCHNRWCLSPRCMWWKTHRDNMREPQSSISWSSSSDSDAEEED